MIVPTATLGAITGNPPPKSQLETCCWPDKTDSCVGIGDSAGQRTSGAGLEGDFVRPRTEFTELIKPNRTAFVVLLMVSKFAFRIRGGNCEPA